VGWLTWLTIVRHPPSAVSCHVANGDGTYFSCEYRGRGVKLLTLRIVDRDDNMAHPLMCQVVFTICRPKLHAYGACNMALPHYHHHSGVQWWWGVMVVMQQWWS